MQPPISISWRRSLVIALLACATPLLYIALTDQLAEDFYITYRFSANLCAGHGLVYNPPEHAYGFTSPLGVLLPAFCRWITPGPSHTAALYLFRFLCVVAFAAAVLLLALSLVPEFHLLSLPPLLLALLVCLDAKTVAYVANGMETAWMLLFFAAALYLSAQPGPLRALPLGMCWAGLLWTRPDGCVYIAALALSLFFFRPEPKSPLLGKLAVAALLAGIIYLPWFVWTSRYYGSPIPETIIAKSTYKTADYSHYVWLALGSLPQLLSQRTALIFAPINFGLFPGWPGWIGLLSTALSVACMAYWTFPVRDAFGRLASFCFTVLVGYLVLIPVIFPWYLPSVAACGLLVLVRGALHLAQLAWPRRRAVHFIAVALLLALAGGMAALLVFTTKQMKLQQEVIEAGNRIPIALWLRDHLRPGDRVYLEPIGYIGFFSGATILDYPGLVSPQVVRLRRERGLDFVGLVPELNPEWLVLRPQEAEWLSQLQFFQEHYRRVRSFDVSSELAPYGGLPGLGWLEHDAAFEVYQRGDAPEKPAPTETEDPPAPGA